MTVTTPSGKEFNCDKATASAQPRRVYLHLIDTSLIEVMMTVSAEYGLPFEQYPEYRAVESISNSMYGVNLVLKRIGDE